MAAEHFATKDIYGNSINEIDFEDIISEKDHEQHYHRSPFPSDIEFCRTYANHDEKCYNGTPKNIPSQKQENRSMFSRGNREKQFSNKWTSLRNDWYCGCVNMQEKISSKDACVQVSIGDLQSYKKISEYNLYDLQDNVNFEETEESIHETCKYCQKPLSASDFECELTSTSYPLKLAEDYESYYRNVKSVPKYAITCCYDYPENQYEAAYQDSSKANEHLPRLHSRRLQSEHLCKGRCHSFAPSIPACHHELCSNQICCFREIRSNPYHSQCSLRHYDRNALAENIPYLPHPSKAVLYYNFQCSCGEILENKDNRHHFEPICDLHHIPESSLPLPNTSKNFHKISNAKYYVEYSKMSDYRTSPKNNAYKRVFLNKSSDNIQASNDFNCCFESKQAAYWKSSSDFPSDCMLKRSDGIVFQPNKASCGTVNNINLVDTSEGTRKGELKESKSIDGKLKTPPAVGNSSYDMMFRNAEKEFQYNVTSNNSARSPTQSVQNQLLTPSKNQKSLADASDSSLSEGRDDGKNAELIKCSVKAVKDGNNASAQRANNANAQRRYRNPEVRDDIYNNADNVLEEMKRVLIQKGKWNGK